MNNSQKNKISPDKLAEKFKSIKLLALDVDGVLTDDSIYFGPDGLEMKKFNISDGFFIALAIRSGLEVAVVSGRYSAATTSRAKDLGIKHVLQEMKDKRKQIVPLLKTLGIEHSQVAFVGNELLDIGLAREVGLSIAVADAADELKREVDYITAAKGGKGAVREVIRAYFIGNNLDPTAYLI
jgi:3-deoxy-D-manno-octulosonate 8-phosphate phosphatase (KDO 8-P phosphatase)